MSTALNEETRFFIYLLEHYSAEKKRNTGEVLREWESHNILSKIYNSYFIYHQEALSNAYQDIDSLLTTGKHAY